MACTQPDPATRQRVDEATLTQRLDATIAWLEQFAAVETATAHAAQLTAQATAPVPEHARRPRPMRSMSARTKTADPAARQELETDRHWIVLRLNSKRRTAQAAVNAARARYAHAQIRAYYERLADEAAETG
jgi:hypothetical protein